MHLEPINGPDGDAGTVDASPVLLVQQTQAVGSATTTFQTDLAMTPLKNDVLVLIGSAEIDPITSVSGGAASWTVVTRASGRHNIEIWYGVVADAASPTVTMTCGACATAHPTWMWLGEWSGPATGATVDAMNTATGTVTGTGNASVALTTHNAPDLLIFGIASYSTVTTDIPGWTPLDAISLPGTTQFEWYQVAPAAGIYTPETTVTSTWEAAAAGFRVVVP